MFRIILLLFLSTQLFSQNIPSQYKLPIVYIEIPDNYGQYKPNGTGFVVRIPLNMHRGWEYLVTAKHVIVDSYTKKVYDTILLRLNLKNGSFTEGFIALNQNAPNKNVFFSNDPSVDLAVIPISLLDTVFDIKFIPVSNLFRSRRDFDTSYVREGTNVFYTGLFSPYLGYKKNEPIVRFGKVCLITDEKIVWDSAKSEISDLFLVETTTFGGNSGSPMFSYPFPLPTSDTSIHRDSSKDSVDFIGIVKGYYGEKTALDYDKVNTSIMIPKYTSNVGITGVIPSYLLYEILYLPELEQARQTEKRKINQ